MTRIRERIGGWLERHRAKQISFAEARRRAQRGAAYLDRVDPGWHRRIDLDALELGSGVSCVLGQLHGSFFSGLSRSHLVDLTSAPRASLSPVRYGFLCVDNVCEALQEQDYEYLNQAWFEEIERRRPEVLAPPVPAASRVPEPIS